MVKNKVARFYGPWCMPFVTVLSILMQPYSARVCRRIL